MKKALKVAGLPRHFSPHCLRHTYASQLLAQGESPVYVQRQLAHSTITLTVDTYGKWLRMEDKGAVDRLDEDGANGSGSKMVANAGSVDGGSSRVLELLVRLAGLEPAT